MSSAADSPPPPPPQSSGDVRTEGSVIKLNELVVSTTFCATGDMMDSKLSQLVDQKCEDASTHHVHYLESKQYCLKIISISKPTAYVGALPPVAQPSVILSLNIKKPKSFRHFRFCSSRTD